MASWPTYRTVILDVAAQGFIDANATPGDRFHEQWDGVVWLISRSPQIGLPRDKTDPNKYLLFVVAANDLAATRELWVLYSYDDGEVVVHGATFAVSENE